MEDYLTKQVTNTAMVNAEKEIDKNGESCCPNLTFKQRLCGFLITFALGFFIMIFNFSPSLNRSDIIFLTFGTCCSIASTFFLNGYKEQIKNMKDPVRATTSLVLVISIILTLFIAIFIPNYKVLYSICYIVQICASFWYILSYIPQAQNCFKKCMACCYKNSKDAIMGNKSQRENLV
jgi:hypothetical protein